MRIVIPRNYPAAPPTVERAVLDLGGCLERAAAQLRHSATNRPSRVVLLRRPPERHSRPAEQGGAEDHCGYIEHLGKPLTVPMTPLQDNTVHTFSFNQVPSATFEDYSSFGDVPT